jgi:hypothetical protein
MPAGKFLRCAAADLGACLRISLRAGAGGDDAPRGALGRHPFDRVGHFSRSALT